MTRVQPGETEHTHMAPRPPAEGALRGTPPVSVVFRAILTDTSNSYMVDRCPVAGYVKIVEFDIHGGVQPSGAYFMPDVEPGEQTSFVLVRDARFEFGTRPVVRS